MNLSKLDKFQGFFLELMALFLEFLSILAHFPMLIAQRGLVCGRVFEVSGLEVFTPKPGFSPNRIFL